MHILEKKNRNSLNHMGLEGAYVNTIKAVHDKPTMNIILYGAKLTAFPLRPGIYSEQRADEDKHMVNAGRCVL